MTPQQVALSLSSLTPEQLAQMPHSLLYQAREYAQPSQQNTLAQYEHQAFAREAVTENPLLAAPIAAGALAYPFYKMFSPGRSDSSLGQVGSGLLGVAQGIGNNFKGLLGQ